MEISRSILRLCVICLLAVLYLVVGGGRQAKADPPDACPLSPENAYCVDFWDCRSWCAQLPGAYPDESVCSSNHCCLCAY